MNGNDAVYGIEMKHDTVREVVGVFHTDGALDTAVEQLELAGVGRAAISVLGVDSERSGLIDTLYRSAEMIEDDPTVRLASFVSPESRTEGEAAAVAVPFAIGGFAGAWAVAATGGALITAIGVTVLSGGVAAGLGALLFRAVAHHHAATIETQLAQGGLVLWVRTPDSASEERAFCPATLRWHVGACTHDRTGMGCRGYAVARRSTRPISGKQEAMTIARPVAGGMAWDDCSLRPPVSWYPSSPWHSSVQCQKHCHAEGKRRADAGGRHTFERRRSR